MQAALEASRPICPAPPPVARYPLSDEQTTQLKAWIGGASNPDAWEERYRGTRDGFGGKAFHSACDGHPRLVVIVKERDRGWIFGGYTAKGFKAGPRQVYTDPDAFLFTLVNAVGRAMKFASKGDGDSVYSYPDYSAVFGGGTDLEICGDANTKTGSYTYITGRSYEAPVAGGPLVMTGGVKDGWFVAEVVAYSVPL